MDTRHYSPLYRQIRDVDPRDHQRVIRVYEEREKDIGRLEVVEHFELTFYYVEALFATGAYQQHQLLVDLVIEKCMEYNVQHVEGLEGDAFQHLLYHKAVGAFRLQQIETATHVARELIRINPAEELNARFLRTCLLRAQRLTLQRGRGTFILFLLLSALFIVLDILLVQPVYPAYGASSQALIAGSFLTAIVCLITFYGYAFGRAHHHAFGFRRAAENKLRLEG